MLVKLNLKKKTIKELSLLSLLSLKKTTGAEIRIISIVFKKTQGAETRIIAIVFKKTPRAETRIIAIVFLKSRQKRELRNNSLLNESDVSRVVFKDSLSELFVAYVRVDERGVYLLVPEHSLNGAQVGAPLKQSRGKRVAEGVG